jgi:tetratricopeptide (TPR) repeat protein
MTHSNPPPESELQATLTGRYRIEGALGAGGMATVYVAEDLRHHRQVAVKVLRADLAASIGADRFLREIEIAAKLNHPHILPLYDSGGAGDVLFYVMPLVEGQSLRDRIAKVGALPVDEAVRIIREVADALAYSHRHGIVHRDIKPENILVSSGHALVTDFGVAKALVAAQRGERPEGGSPNDLAETALTSLGISLGTPAYMAPEQATADPALDHRADIYALGVVAYELLAGRPPFLANTPQQMIAAHITQRPDALSVRRSAVPPALEAVVMRCLEKNPADRWQHAEDVLRALDALDAAARPSRTRVSRRVRVMTAGAVAAVVLAIGGVSWFARTGRAGTLIGDDVLARNDLVLVSEFENHTADSSLGGTVTDAIRMDLQDSRAVRVMSQAAMWSGLERMGLARGTFLPQPKVQELAEREGAKAYVVGNIARVGGSYEISARVVATNGGAEPLTAHATARDSIALIGAVEEVGHTLRRGIGESLRSVLAAPALAQVTTASLPALRAYSAAQRAEIQGQRPRAVVLEKDAISLDTTFAAAWAGLYVTYSNMGFVRLATEAAQRAFALRDHLSDVERLKVEADYHSTRGENVEEEAAWQRLAELGLNQIGYSNFLLGQGRLREAEAMARRAIVAEPKHPIGYWNLAEAQVGQLHFASADSTAMLIAAQLPDNNYRYFIPVDILWGRRDFDRLEAYLQSPEAAKLPPAARMRCLVDLRRGRIRAWQRCPVHDGIVDGNPQLIMAEFRMTGDSVRARGGYEKFLTTARDDRDPDQYADVIALLADVGRVRDASALLDEWRARAGPGDLGFRADSAQAVGAIAAAEGKWDAAVAAFLAWNGSVAASSRHIYNRGLPEAAAILARRGQPDSAVVLFERALATSSLFGGEIYEASWYAQALSMLGDLHEARGDRAKAAEYYQRYVEMLKDADPPLAAQVTAVRAKLARAVGEPRPPGTR